VKFQNFNYYERNREKEREREREREREKEREGGFKDLIQGYRNSVI